MFSFFTVLKFLHTLNSFLDYAPKESFERPIYIQASQKTVIFFLVFSTSRQRGFTGRFVL